MARKRKKKSGKNAAKKAEVKIAATRTHRLISLIDEPLKKIREQTNAHGNRELHLDHLVIAHLVAFFNPVAATLRKIENVFEQESVQKRFSLPRVPRSTLSDAQRAFDPALLKPLIDDLKSRLNLQPKTPKLDKITQQILAVDGTFFTVAPRIAWAIYNKPKSTPRQPRHDNQKGNVRVDVQFDVTRGMPVCVSEVGDGQSTEGQELAKNLEKNKLYLIDRGYQAYGLFSKIIAKKSDFVVRLQKKIVGNVVEERTLSEDDKTAGVLSDQEITIPSSRAKCLRDARLRLVTIKGEKEDIRLLTNRFDLSAEMIGVLYRHRWQVELFFRWLKCCANFKHFMSESQGGMTLQFYAAILGTLLMALATNSQPNSYDFSLISAVMNGLGTLEEALPILEKNRAERERIRQRRLAKRAAEKQG